AFTEALTQIGPHGVSDVLYRSVAEHYSDIEISELNFAIVAINAWNR
ncbi:MAG TPA: carboxymuconolactone decarboxylase family protein, partial [Leclercia adecarboxylata]|nr:carboxymuconolactone decarboxylase family protein [Leclercia adecarboxylata]